MPSRSAWGFRGDSSDDRWWQSALFFATVLLLLLALQAHFASTTHRRSHPPEMAIVLKNGDLEVHVLRIGVIQRLLVPDRNGKIDDIVLGFDTEEPYADGTSPYFGAVVGRVANRIANAHFTLNGKEYKLAANNGPNCLHGGIIGFSRVQWRVVEEKSSDVSVDGSASLRLAYTSPDGDEGFPGTVEAQVTYTLTKDNRLRVEMKATSDAPTPLNLAQHSYFNLGGHASGDVLDHTLQLEATHWTPVNDVQIPTGAVEPVEATPAMDFRSAHRVGERIKQVPGDEPKGYDHNYALFGLGPDAAAHVHHGMASKEPKLAATLIHPGTGRGMRLHTNAPGVQFYSGNFLDGSVVGKEGTAYARHAGLCLETQGWPDSINQPNFPSVVIAPGETYHHVVEYEFFTTD